ncbi:MAG: single-stranded DNA-binding protein [Solobacterium sp.]|nr:single-stranded DNA-binding protein [Solobacterium sp.]
MFDLNEVTLRGTLTQAPVFRDTKNNTRMCSFTLSVKRKDPSQIRDFLDVVAWGRTAQAMEGLFNAGDAVEVKGGIRRNVYTDDSGQKRVRWEISADRADLFVPEYEGEILPEEEG